MKPDTDPSSAASARGRRVGGLALDLLGRVLPQMLRRAASGRVGMAPANAGRMACDLAFICAWLARRPAQGRGAPSRDELAAEAVRQLGLCDPDLWPPETHHPPFSCRPNGFLSGFPGLVLLLLGDRVPAGLAQRVRESAARAADWYLTWRPFSGLYFDTKAEETAWETTIPAVAEALCPDHPNRGAWRGKARDMALNSYSRETDAHDAATTFDGTTLASLVHTANVFPDFTVHNHGGFNPCYQVCHNTMAPAYYVYQRFLGGAPPWFTWNWAGLHEVAKRLILRDGHFLWPSGNDYWPHTHVGFCNYHGLMADALGCGVSLWCLEKVLRHCLDEVAREPDGRLWGRRCPGLPLHWESHFLSMVAVGNLFAPYPRAPELDDEQAAAQTQGCFVSNHADFVVQNGPRISATYSWQPVYGMGQAFGCVLPSDDVAWTEAWCSIPNLVGTVRLAEGSERQIIPDDPQGYINHERVRLCDPGECLGHRRNRIQGHSRGVVWSVGQLLDDQGDVLHSVGLVAGADAVLHLERFVRYGEKTPIRGVETLNYVMTNEPVDRDGFRVEWPGGEAFVRVGDWRLDDAGDALLLDRRLAVVRVWGNTRLCAEQRRAERVRNGINPARPWRLRVWGERVGPQAPDPYAVLAEQVVLFVPAASVQEALAAGRAVTVSASPMGRWEVRVGLPAWRGAFAVDFGTDLAFYDFGLDGDAARGLSAQRREKWRKDVGHE